MKRAPGHLYAPLPWMLLPCPRSRLRGKNMIVSYLPWGDIAGILVRFWVRSSRRRTRKTSIEWASAARFWLMIFDVPAFICCNRSGQFVVCWFKIMCKHMGIIHAKTVAYHTPSNSRVEVAGRQMFEKFCQLHIGKPGKNWFHSLWMVLQALHHLPGPTELASHRILFLRE